MYTDGMHTQYRPRRDFEALEQRRKRAARLFAAGRLIVASIARHLQVSRQSVSRWYEQWKRGGTTALRGAGRAGRKPKLSTTQRRRVERALRQGARAHGYGTDLWTLPRVAVVIERLTGVHYHPGHVWKILGAMDWTLQRPARQARESNPEAIRYWISERWPAVKKTSAPESLDFLPGRKRRLPTALGAADLGAPRRDSGLDPCFQLEISFGLCRAGLPLGRAALPFVLSDSPRQL